MVFDGDGASQFVQIQQQQQRPRTPLVVHKNRCWSVLLKIGLRSCHGVHVKQVVQTKFECDRRNGTGGWPRSAKRSPSQGWPSHRQPNQIQSPSQLLRRQHQLQPYRRLQQYVLHFSKLTSAYSMFPPPVVPSLSCKHSSCAVLSHCSQPAIAAGLNQGRTRR